MLELQKKEDETDRKHESCASLECSKFPTHQSKDGWKLVVLSMSNNVGEYMDVLCEFSNDFPFLHFEMAFRTL
jgi:hypothetical protein